MWWRYISLLSIEFPYQGSFSSKNFSHITTQLFCHKRNIELEPKCVVWENVPKSSSGKQYTGISKKWRYERTGTRTDLTLRKIYLRDGDKGRITFGYVERKMERSRWGSLNYWREKQEFLEDFVDDICKCKEPINTIPNLWCPLTLEDFPSRIGSRQTKTHLGRRWGLARESVLYTGLPKENLAAPGAAK